MSEKNQESNNVITCVYCGHAYLPGTPTHGAPVLTEHIKVCEKHPMRKVEQDKQKLRRALIELVGCKSSEELDAMESAIRLTPGAEEDKAAAINAIHALRETAD